MVSRKTIGKIQIWIGLILIIGSVVGLKYSHTNYNEKEESSLGQLYGEMGEWQKSEEFNESSNSTRMIMVYSVVNNYFNKHSEDFNIWLNSTLALCISILISVLFITQGLANISTNEMRKQ